MKWKDILNHKYNTGLALITLLIMMLILMFAHRRNVSELQDSFSSIYTDRLVAVDLLYDLSHMIYEKKILFDRHDNLLPEQTVRVNDTIQQLIKKYENTYLTVEESGLLSTIKDHIRISQAYEKQFTYQVSSAQLEGLRHELANHYDLILSGLDNLTRLQLHEGQKLTDQSNRIVASENVTFRLAIGLFLIMGVLIFMLYSSIPSYRTIKYPSLN